MESLELDLPEARHPLLMPVLLERLGEDVRSRRAPVPVSLRLGYGEPVLVISGPNTGGKTVALKTLGLFALMAQSGLHVPAAAGAPAPRLPAHLRRHRRRAVDRLEPLHLLRPPRRHRGDDPRPGAARPRAPRRGGRRHRSHRGRRPRASPSSTTSESAGAMVVATTHHGLMKGYAQSTPGVTSGSFGYDPHTYEPTYRLSLGVPGRSLALEMAERLGLPACGGAGCPRAARRQGSAGRRPAGAARAREGRDRNAAPAHRGRPHRDRGAPRRAAEGREGPCRPEARRSSKPSRAS